VKTIRHVPVFELVDQLVHHGLDHAGGVGAGDVAVQPALGVRNHRHRVTGTANNEAFRSQLVDQRLNARLVAQHVLDVGADGEVDVAVGEFVADVTQLAQGVQVENTLGASAHGEQCGAVFGDVLEYAGLRIFVIVPVTVVLAHQRVHVLEAVRAAGLDRWTWSVSHISIPTFLLY